MVRRVGREVNRYIGQLGTEGRLVRMQVDIDEETLLKIAKSTNGEYFRATDAEELKKIYEEIDRLEKSTIETKTYTSYTDKYALFAISALLLLAVELALAETVLREVP